jgi:hypothetical protein
MRRSTFQSEKGKGTSKICAEPFNSRKISNSRILNRKIDFTFLMDSLTEVLMQLNPMQRELVERILSCFSNMNQLGPEEIANLSQELSSYVTNNDTHHAKMKSVSRNGRKKKTQTLPGQRTLDQYWNS